MFYCITEQIEDSSAKNDHRERSDKVHIRLPYLIEVLFIYYLFLVCEYQKCESMLRWVLTLSGPIQGRKCNRENEK
jgi:hypothetical protein